MKSWKETKLYSILTVKCPRCHEGDMFPPNTLYKPGKFDKMNEFCPCCRQPFEPEPGYYYGAMFVSYAFSTAIFIAVWIALSFLVEEVSITMMVIAILVIVVGLLPINFRLSRAMWINFFISYKGPCEEIKKE
ncbi:DUF983 domain-containing protein [Pontibacter silvestris]|uniref:DUF983 domain-containing protein n=1 Tax=Pontibacter silvestris TaxID=2305183 RepID=A0ABW4WZ43_9BACT|nr:DUF983 domain-containing protein [Pontibacter silvestris]MCC9135438.1 DUF983 domain-containing protein [Pontibacter silvestris]